ncbi:MAG: pentapeptide repeat-containing protein [Microcoleus sp.]
MAQENSENLLQKMWKVLTTDHRELLRGRHDLVVDGVDSLNAVISGAVAVAGVAGTVVNPAVAVVAAGVGFVQIAVRWQKRFQNKPQDDRTFSDYVQFAAVLAYCKALDKYLNDNNILTSINLESVDSEQFKQQIEELAESSLDEREARRAIDCFPQSKLAEKFNNLLLNRLQEVGLDERTAKTLTERVAWSTPRYISEALAEAKDELRVLAELYRDRWQKDLDKYDSIDTYLEEQIGSKPQEKVFAEDFTFKDIYVPLKARKIDKNGKVDRDAEAFDLETWAKELLADENKQERVMFVEAGPGRGKSVFCRIFADLVRQNLHPVWTPVLIRLRDIRTFHNSFIETLKEAVKTDFTNDIGWLTDRNTRYLFFLDGFDELVMQRRKSVDLDDFIKQVGQFQQDCQQSSEMRHRVLITGRTLALQGIERQIPDNLERVEIQVMDDELQQKWLSKWESQIGTEKTSAFQEFLQHERCPKQVKSDLAREPLLLYLLAAMHRDRELKVEDFQGTNSTQSKILIYNKAVNWVLTEQRSDKFNRKLNQNLTGLETEDLRRILIETGLCVVQSGGEYASVAMIKARLTAYESVKSLFEDAQKPIGDNHLKNALAVFYLQQGSPEGSVEFVHKSFGEFLCAERLKESLEEWTEPGKKGRGFNTKDDEMAWQIYDLLGYGGLTAEILEYLMGLLTTPADGEEASRFHPVKLFQRLEDFYQQWCEGEFIDMLPESLPQKKMRLLREQLKTQELGQKQIDIYAGLNVMILLLELHRYGQQRDELKDQMVFHPCGKANAEGKLDDAGWLLRLIGYSCCVGNFSFVQTVGRFLNGANLVGANLIGANLIGANLIGANLMSTDIRGANLSGADLSRADFSDAKLSRTDLVGAYLIGANLSHANLSYADLSRADLSDAYLIGANLSDANLSYADLRGAHLIGANLSRADLRGAHLIGADLCGTNLISANLSSADFSGADLSRAYLGDTNLSDANLSDANLSHANLSDANLSRANLRGANLRGADLHRANLCDANLCDANLSGANLSRANLSGANLSRVNLSDANLSHAELSRANFSRANFSETFGDVKWNINTNWKNVRGLGEAVNVPEALRRQLGMD